MEAWNSITFHLLLCWRRMQEKLLTCNEVKTSTYSRAYWAKLLSLASEWQCLPFQPQRIAEQKQLVHTVTAIILSNCARQCHAMDRIFAMPDFWPPSWLLSSFILVSRRPENWLDSFACSILRVGIASHERKWTARQQLTRINDYFNEIQ